MSEKEICYKIYSDEFGDDEFAKELFENCYKYCHAYRVDNEITAILFLLPCEIIVENKRHFAKYVFAVTTNKMHRNKGYMSKFLETVYNEDEIFFLKPVNSSLISFYKRLGYKDFDAIKSVEGEKYVLPCDEFLKFAQKYADFSNGNYTLMYKYKEDINLNNLCFSYAME